MEDPLNQDICRVCRCEATSDRVLFHPCICTGSIKYIHQDCLLQWLRYSRKEYCELCKHRFTFTPIYSPDMPKRLPIKDIVSGLTRSMGTAIRYWLHYTMVATAWLGIVPLTACRIYRFFFTASLSSVFTLTLDMLSSENLFSDIFHGCIVVTCTLSAFISLVWLREQILHGGGPDWLDQDGGQEDVPDLVLGDVMADADLANRNPAPPDGQDIEVQPGDDVQNEEPAANANGDVEGGNDVAAAADDVNWNPIEWDRAAEELTWERLLGLDGSLVFLEHVFWVVSLNTMFILVFAFCPYHIGNFAIVGLKMKPWVAASHFEGLLTTLCGYCIVGVCLVILHGLAALVRLTRSKRILGLCYVVVKVALLSVVEIGVFPLIGGWWLDICSLGLLDATLKDRESNFRIAPGTSMFIHWLVGMVYVFYFANFILLLREVLRPGVLWFLRNLNDPDFNPVQEMIHLPIIRHTRRFLGSMVIFGSTVLMMLWLPIRIIQGFWPSFLPYHITLSSDIPVSELSLELLLLRVIMPTLLEQGHTRVWLKLVIRHWCILVSQLLGLRSYLLGDVPLDPQPGGEVIRGDGGTGVIPLNNGAVPANERENNVNNPPPPPPPPPEAAVGDGLGGGLGAAHQALLLREGPTGFQPYVRPKWFMLRIFGLVVMMCISLTASSVVCLTVPILVGRQAMYLALGETKVHELYTGACGLYLCMLAIRGIMLLASWIFLGWTEILTRLRQWLVLGGKALIVLAMVAIIIPLMAGVLMELVIIVPFRVPLHQTPIFFFWQDWALGVLYTKIVCASVMMGPNWWLKTNLELIYFDGLRNINLDLVIRRTSLPIIAALGLCLAIPYVSAHTVSPFLAPTESLILVERRIYPALLLLSIIACLVVTQVLQFSRLYEHIKNDKYLVGRRLVNYHHASQAESTQQASEAGESQHGSGVEGQGEE